MVKPFERRPSFSGSERAEPGRAVQPDKHDDARSAGADRFLAKPSERYAVGLLLRAPVPLNQMVKTDNQEYSFDATSGIFTNSFSQSETSQSARRPPGATLGLALHPSLGRTFSFDLSYYGSAGYSVSSRQIDIRPVWNAAFGFEEVIRPKFPIRFGLYTNRSAAPRLNDRPTVQDDRVDSYGRPRRRLHR